LSPPCTSSSTNVTNTPAGASNGSNGQSSNGHESPTGSTCSQPHVSCL
jgi:hypothetical protein